MGAFQYVAVDSGGKRRKGVIEGDTARQVRQLLRERSLLPVEVNEISEQGADKDPSKSSLSLRRGISALDLALLTRQLATLVRAGMPLDESLQAISEQTEKPRIKTIIVGVRSKVMEGHSLASGFQDFPNAFPEVYRATVSAGEQAGHLDTVLERLADYTEGRHALRQKVSNAMIYPLALTIIALSIIGMMLVYVVPKVISVFRSTGNELPILTRGLIATSDFLQSWWWLVAVGVGATIWAIRKTLSKEGPRRSFHKLLLRTPLLSRLARGLNTARFTRTLSILTSSGVPVLDALRISASVVTNLPMRDAIEEAAVKVREGGAISRALATNRLFPPMTIHLIGSGEASGELDDMLERAASHQEREMDSLIEVMLGVMEPLIIVAMGIVVVLIVLAILLPIFQINQLVG
jgi:general secretion pathway protein F